MTFHPFPRLPSELQTQIWEYHLSGSCMHVLDVCFPSRDRNRTERAFRKSPSDENNNQDVAMRLQRYRNKAFLDALEQDSPDPSTYHCTNSLRRTNRLAAWAAKTKETRDGSTTVHLPARDTTFTIPSSDVLLLRLRDQSPPSIVHDATTASRIGPVLGTPWSASLTHTLRTARRIALDVAEACIFSPPSPLGWDETTRFAALLHEQLEVLYLVDGCRGNYAQGRGLQRRGSLWKRLDRDGGRGDDGRPGDVIRGAGARRYVEVFDLEALGWGDCQAYGFAFLMNSAIRMHQGQSQGGKCVFQGIRVLVVEEDCE